MSPGPGSMASPKPIRGMHTFTRRKTKAQRLLEAYEVVNRRDGNLSRVSGCYLLPTSADNRQRREHHHLKGRNVRPDWRCAPERIILCSAFEHGLLEHDAILYEGDDARERIVFFWNREKVKPGEEPIRLLSKRWSQNEEV